MFVAVVFVIVATSKIRSHPIHRTRLHFQSFGYSATPRCYRRGGDNNTIRHTFRDVHVYDGVESFSGGHFNLFSLAYGVAAYFGDRDGECIVKK